MKPSKLKKIRLSKKMTMRDLEAKSKVSLSTICLIENNKVSPMLSNLEKIAKALGVKLTDLY